MRVLYTDEINERRVLEKTIEFDSTYFEGRAADQNGVSPWVWVVVIIVILIIFIWWRSRKKNKHKHKPHG